MRPLSCFSLSPSFAGRGRGEGLSRESDSRIVPLTRGLLRADAPRKRGEVSRPHPEEARSAVSKDEANALKNAPARTANGLLLRSVPDRSCQRGVAVSGGVGPVDHFRRDADRQFRPWRVLHARRLCRVHADRAIFRRDRILGRHRRRGADRRRRRRAGRNGAAAADLSCARIVSAAGDLRPDPDGRGSRGADLGPERSAGPPRAGISRARSISSARIFRPTICS